MKPSGDLYLEEEAKIQKKYKNSPEVLEDIRILSGLLSTWYMEVFMGLLRSMYTCPECTKLVEVMNTIDGVKK